MKTKDFDLYMTDIDYIKAEDKPMVRIFGRTSEGVPVLLQIDDFLPYIFIPHAKKEQFEKCMQENQLLEEWLISTETHSKIKYDGGETIEFLKLLGKRPWEVPKIRELLEKNGIKHFESDIPFVKRFLIDTGLRGLNIFNVSSVVREQKKAGGYILGSQTKHIKPSDVDPLRFRKLTHLALDIEVDDRHLVEFEELKKQNRRIIAISLCWGTSQDRYKTHVFYLEEDSDTAEKKLLKEFFKCFREIQPDIVIGYNTDAFDFPYITDRTEKLKLSTTPLSLLDDTLRYSGRIRAHRMRGRIVCDVIKKIGKITTESGRRGLGDVAQKLLGTKKIELKESVGKLWAKGVLENDKKRLKSFINYSEMDAILPYRLWWELELENILELIRIVGFPPAEGMYATERNQGELELMRKCVQRHVLIPNSSVPDETRQRQKMKEEDGLKGGMVIGPTGAFHKEVVIFDFRSLYPSIIIAYNVGGETFQGKPDDSFEFKKKPKSVLAEMEEYILSYRFKLKHKKKELEKKLIEMKIEKKDKTDEYLDLQEDLKNIDRRQSMLKLVANALYGTIGSVFGRFYLLHVAKAITSLGRQHLTNLVELIEQYNEINAKHFKVVYGDTDSIFVSLSNKDRSFEQLYNLTMRSKKEKITHKELKSVEKDVYTSIDHLLDFLGSKLPEGMQLELDDIAFRIIFQPGRKKAYGYVSALNGELHVKGFEAIRGDWTVAAKRIQLKVIDILLRSSETAAMENAKQFVLEECRTLLNAPIEEIKDYLIQYAPISRSPEKYKSITPAVGAFLHYCEVNNLDPKKEWKNISKFPYIILKGEGPQYKRARHPNLMNSTEIDREQYVKEVLGAVSKFGVKLDLDTIKGKGRIKTLDDFV